MDVDKALWIAATRDYVGRQRITSYKASISGFEGERPGSYFTYIPSYVQDGALHACFWKCAFF